MSTAIQALLDAVDTSDIDTGSCAISRIEDYIRPEGIVMDERACLAYVAALALAGLRALDAEDVRP